MHVKSLTQIASLLPIIGLLLLPQLNETVSFRVADSSELRTDEMAEIEFDVILEREQLAKQGSFSLNQLLTTYGGIGIRNKYNLIAGSIV